MLLEALATIGFLFGSLIIGAVILFIGLYIYAIIKNNRESKKWTNRYYR